MRNALAEIGVCCMPATDRLAVTIRVYPPDRRRRDLDNLTKSILDLLTKAKVWIDDSQIDDLRIIRQNIVPNGRIEIEICQLPVKT